MARPVLVTFDGGEGGAWAIERIDAIAGAALAPAPRLAIVERHAGHEGHAAPPGAASWRLRGVTSNERYVGVAQRAALLARQPALGQPEATLACLIPITKSDAWWDLTQEERLAVFGPASRHVEIGLEYLPAVARRLHHGRDLGEPFDFLTWFEFAPEDEPAFDQLLRRLRATEEWRYVTREVEIRLSRVTPPGATPPPAGAR